MAIRCYRATDGRTRGVRNFAARPAVPTNACSPREFEPVMEEHHLEDGWSPRLRRAGRVFARHLAKHAAPPGGLRAADGFAIHCVRDGARHILAAMGQLDLANAWRFEQELRRAEASDAQEILVDLGGVDFIDSAGMQVVVHASSRSRLHSKRLMILGGPASVQRSFELSGLAGRLPFVDRRPGIPLA